MASRRMSRRQQKVSVLCELTNKPNKSASLSSLSSPKVLLKFNRGKGDSEVPKVSPAKELSQSRPATNYRTLHVTITQNISQPLSAIHIDLSNIQREMQQEEPQSEYVAVGQERTQEFKQQQLTGTQKLSVSKVAIEPPVSLNQSKQTRKKIFVKRESKLNLTGSAILPEPSISRSIVVASKILNQSSVKCERRPNKSEIKEQEEFVMIEKKILDTSAADGQKQNSRLSRHQPSVGSRAKKALFVHPIKIMKDGKMTPMQPPDQPAIRSMYSLHPQVLSSIHEQMKDVSRYSKRPIQYELEDVFMGKCCF